jgi:hypothetical protein
VAAEPSEWSRPAKAAVAAMVALLVGVLTPFLPCASVTYFGVEAIRYGFQEWNGLVAGGCCLAGLMVLASTELFHPARAWRVWTPLAAGLVVIGVTTAYLADLSRGPTITSKEYQGDEMLHGFAEMLMRQTLGGIQARPLIGPYAALTVGVLLVGLGLFALRSGKPPATR